MARKIRTDLDYFRFDVGFFNDGKLIDVQNEYGPLGEVIYLRLLCLIYSDKGYYYRFESLDKLAGIIIKSIGNRWVHNKDYVAKIISFLAECNLFSKELMRENILTSVGIQNRYAFVIEKVYKRKVRITKYNLIEKANKDVGFEFVPENEVNSEETTINSEETKGFLLKNATKESKENKSNQMKTNESKSAEGGLPANFSQIDADDLDYRNTLIKEFGEKQVTIYEKKFDKWAEGKKLYANASKYEIIGQWLVKDFGY